MSRPGEQEEEHSKAGIYVTVSVVGMLLITNHSSEQNPITSLTPMFHNESISQSNI